MSAPRKSKPRVPLDVALERARVKRVNAYVRDYKRRNKGDPDAALTALASDFESMMDLYENLLDFASGKWAETQGSLREIHEKRVNAGLRDTREQVKQWLDANHSKVSSIEAASIAVGKVVARAPITVKRYVREWNDTHHRWGISKKK
ncbi:hypothetical protein [Variovorax sp. OV329]|uniref:hypothetical protein n=1 Tax=Variovorax sp. OV329 TaxID=1882825 RepID=UPI0008EFB32D|nr:hypothetical protein [Variovorax sp. OV329]SFL87452.1 hypothetical protein SAMN05444747_10176 [Variovorax sp. OV329]